MAHVVTDHFDDAFSEFKTRHGIHHIIAFSGGASTQLPGIDASDPLQSQFSAVQNERESRIVKDTLNLLRHYRLAVLTGGTRFGFPQTAVEVAHSLGIKTIGVFPLTAHAKGHVLEQLDLGFSVGPSFKDSVWGDESHVFTKLLDAVVVCGGGAGTLIEVAHILKMNESLLKNGKPVKRIVPIAGTAGVADGLPFIWGKPEIKNACMPRTPIVSGHEAANYIQEHLDLFNL